MTTLTGAPPVSIASAGPMSLASLPVSGEVYNDAKLLIEGLNKHAGSEGYAVVTARSKKSKKGVDRIVYIRCDRGGKASLNSEILEDVFTVAHGSWSVLSAPSANGTRMVTGILKSYETGVTIILLHSPQLIQLFEG